MALNYIWIAFFVVAFVVALLKMILTGDTLVFKQMVDGLFDTTKVSVMDIALPLVGMMSFWLGIMRIGEKAGAIRFLSKIVNPFFSRLFPSLPKNDPSLGHMMMNFSANLLGLDNAATPLGIRAMESLQTHNPDKEKATDAQIMFLVLHASGLTLIPATIMLYRYLNGAADPTDIFIPCIIATFCTTLFGIIIVSIKQKINLFQPVLMAWLIGAFAFLMGLSYFIKNDANKRVLQAQSYISNHIPTDSTFAKSLDVKKLKNLYPTDFQKEIKIEKEINPKTITEINLQYVNFERATASRVMSNVLLMLIPILFILGGFRKKINVFENFIEGAKEGFEVAIKIIPYLVAMLAAISVLRNSGVFEYILTGLSFVFTQLGVNTDFIAALPTALMKPLSGSGSRALMIETMQTYGADSFAGRLASVFQGSADTTFYIIALYFGSVGIKKIRYALTAGLLTEFLGVISAIFIAYYFFG